MANLDRLLGLRGAFAAGEFSPTGELVAYKGDLSEDVARLTARMCAANSLLFTSEMESFTKISGERWLPHHGWAISAGDWSVCVVGHIGVLVRTAKADFNDIYKVLSDEAHITLKAA